jgi:hypothetical protein
MNRSLRVLLGAVVLLSSLSTALASDVSIPGAFGVSPFQPKRFPEPPLRAQAAGAAALVVTLEATSEGDLAAMRQYNASGQLPTKAGIVRDLPQPAIFTRGVTAAADQPWRWRGAVHVARAQRLRLKLTDLQVPADATFWVYGASGETVGFDRSLAHEGTLWTPTIEGDTITVEVEAPAGPASFTIAAVADFPSPAIIAPEDDTCITDSKCYTGLDDLAKAIGSMVYVSGGAAYICTGGMLNDSTSSFTPHFITANHCIATASEAASLEVTWNFRTASCDGLTPSKTGLPRTNGSTILVTNETTDVTLLRLTSSPGGRLFLGWNSTPPGSGDTLYRLSHPLGQPLRYSTSTVNTTSGTCTDWQRPNFLYQTHAIGTTAGGSSGSPVLNESGQVVGQLAGSCGPEPTNPCNHLNRTVDGAFSSSFPLLQPFLSPGTSTCNACVPNANTACALGGRFKIQLTWRDFSANLSGNGSIIKYADNIPATNPAYGVMSESTFFSMYTTAPTDIEAIVRILRGVGINNKFWIFVTGFASNEYTITVTDTGSNCRTWTRTVASGSTTMIKDFDAFTFP